MTKKEEILEPEVEEIQVDEALMEELKKIGTNLESSNVSMTSNEDTFYKQVVAKLFDPENIETKTEYLNVEENFMGTKLSFISKFGNIPMLHNFVKIFERKRVSLNRKGREEIILALQERRRELEEMNKASFLNRFT